MQQSINLLLKAFVLLFIFCAPNLVFAQPGADYKVASIGFYNLENLFDTLDSPTTNDVDFLVGDEAFVQHAGSVVTLKAYLSTRIIVEEIGRLDFVKNPSEVEDTADAATLSSWGTSRGKFAGTGSR